MSDLPSKTPPSDVAEYEEAEPVFSLLNSISRVAPRDPPDVIEVVSVLGNITLDYRNSHLPLGVTEVDCKMYLGNVEILAPADVDVEVTGSVILGTVEVKDQRGPGHVDSGEDELPVLRVDCAGFMGNIEIRIS